MRMRGSKEGREGKRRVLVNSSLFITLIRFLYHVYETDGPRPIGKVLFAIRTAMLTVVFVRKGSAGQLVFEPCRALAFSRGSSCGEARRRERRG